MLIQLLCKVTLSDGRTFAKHSLISMEVLKTISSEHSWINVRILQLPQ